MAISLRKVTGGLKGQVVVQVMKMAMMREEKEQK